MRTAVLLFLGGWIAPFLLAQTPHDLLDARSREFLHETLSGENAKEHVIQITRFNRVQASRGYRSAAHYVLSQLRSFGFDENDAYIESFPSDGIIHYQTWQSPPGWDITSAELRMLEPSNERIVGYPEIGMSLVTCSNAGDATAELVWVGAGVTDGDYAGKDVAGKFVLATGYGGEVHRQAVIKRSAKGVICYLDDSRAKLHPDMLQYTGMWPKPDELKKVTFGFNLTRNQGERLRTLLAEGKRVVLHGSVKGKGIEPYFMDIVVAHVRGNDPDARELVLSAHLDHPKESANDNASGSGAILDMARALKELVGSGKLARPRHSIRFLWVPEWNGTMAYIDKHPELVGPPLGGKLLANVNMDMVGEGLRHNNAVVRLGQSPGHLPSYVDGLARSMLEYVWRTNDFIFMSDAPRGRPGGQYFPIPMIEKNGSLDAFRFSIQPTMNGSDQICFYNPSVAVPGIMFLIWPDWPPSRTGAPGAK